MLKPSSLIFLCFALAFGAGFALAQEQIMPYPKENAVESPVPLWIVTKQSKHKFIVEVARTESQHQQGLMGRTELAPNSGMVFLFDPPREVSMWMKDTLIPLDMLFVNPQGKIFRLREGKPNDLTPLASNGKTAAVVELPHGTVKKFNIRIGDKVLTPALKEDSTIAKP